MQNDISILDLPWPSPTLILNRAKDGIRTGCYPVPWGQQHCKTVFDTTHLTARRRRCRTIAGIVPLAWLACESGVLVILAKHFRLFWLFECARRPKPAGSLQIIEPVEAFEVVHSQRRGRFSTSTCCSQILCPRLSILAYILTCLKRSTSGSP
ncbi:hypothetical protein F4859DRAFT_495648 [Xylaria cf. heliscus]|nr:hypothetical protein F4859DRAFT_495648 [Xylaria cf. heliscus]